MGHRTLIFVRHGQYVRPPERLTDLGRAQAELVAARLAPLPVDAVWSSRLPRAEETADYVASHHPEVRRRTTADLNECLPGVPRMDLPWVGDFPPETLRAGASRIDKAWRRIGRSTTGADRLEIVVCHGNVIRAVMLRALDLEPSAWPEPHIHHASITTLRVHRKRTRLVGYNDIGHLPPAMQTEA